MKKSIIIMMSLLSVLLISSCSAAEGAKKKRHPLLRAVKQKRPLLSKARLIQLLLRLLRTRMIPGPDRPRRYMMIIPDTVNSRNTSFGKPLKRLPKTQTLSLCACNLSEWRSTGTL